MSTTHDNIPVVASQATTLAGFLTSLMGWLTTEVGLGVIGAFCAIIGVVGTIYFSHRRVRDEERHRAEQMALLTEENTRKRALHEARMGFFKRMESCPNPGHNELVEGAALGIDLSDFGELDEPGQKRTSS